MNQFQRYLLDEFVHDYMMPGTYAGIVVIHENRGLHHTEDAIAAGTFVQQQDMVRSGATPLDVLAYTPAG